MKMIGNVFGKVKGAESNNIATVCIMDAKHVIWYPTLLNGKKLHDRYIRVILLGRFHTIDYNNYIKAKHQAISCYNRYTSSNMVHQAIVGYDNYVYCHDCGIIKSRLTGKIIKPKNGTYHFYNGMKVVSIPQDSVYVYEASSSSSSSNASVRILGLALLFTLIMSIMLGWSALILTFCLSSRPG